MENQAPNDTPSPRSPIYGYSRDPKDSMRIIRDDIIDVGSPRNDSSASQQQIVSNINLGDDSLNNSESTSRDQFKSSIASLTNTSKNKRKPSKNEKNFYDLNKSLAKLNSRRVPGRSSSDNDAVDKISQQLQTQQISHQQHQSQHYPISNFEFAPSFLPSSSMKNQSPQVVIQTPSTANKVGTYSKTYYTSMKKMNNNNNTNEPSNIMTPQSYYENKRDNGPSISNLNSMSNTSRTHKDSRKKSRGGGSNIKPSDVDYTKFHRGQYARGVGGHVQHQSQHISPSSQFLTQQAIESSRRLSDKPGKRHTHFSSQYYFKTEPQDDLFNDIMQYENQYMVGKTDQDLQSAEMEQGEMTNSGSRVNTESNTRSRDHSGNNQNHNGSNFSNSTVHKKNISLGARKHRLYDDEFQQNGSGSGVSTQPTGQTPSFKNIGRSPVTGQQSTFGQEFSTFEKGEYSQFASTARNENFGMSSNNDSYQNQMQQQQQQQYDLDNDDTLQENEQYEQIIQQNTISDGVEYRHGGFGRGSSAKKNIDFQIVTSEGEPIEKVMKVERETLESWTNDLIQVQQDIKKRKKSSDNVNQFMNRLGDTPRERQTNKEVIIEESNPVEQRFSIDLENSVDKSGDGIMMVSKLEQKSPNNAEDQGSPNFENAKKRESINKRISFDVKTDEFTDEQLETRPDQRTAGSKSKVSYYDFTNETQENMNNSFVYSNGILLENQEKPACCGSQSGNCNIF